MWLWRPSVQIRLSTPYEDEAGCYPLHFQNQPISRPERRQLYDAGDMRMLVAQAHLANVFNAAHGFDMIGPYWDVAKSVRHQTLTLAFRRFESCHPNHAGAKSALLRLIFYNTRPLVALLETLFRKGPARLGGSVVTARVRCCRCQFSPPSRCLPPFRAACKRIYESFLTGFALSHPGRLLPGCSAFCSSTGWNYFCLLPGAFFICPIKPGNLALS